MQTSTYTAVLGAILALILAAVLKRRQRRLPPGPRGLPIVGNIFDTPKSHDWLTYQEWSHKYDSDIVYFEVLGNHVVVINSTKASHELFEKRSHIYSGKAQSVMTNELVGFDRLFVTMDYTDQWRDHRKMFNQHFRPAAVPAYHPVMAQQVRKLLSLLLDTPDDFLSHIRYTAGATILKIVYAFDIKLKNDPYVDMIEEVIKIFSVICIPGAYLVNGIPVLKYLPSWFPGAEFKREASRWYPLVQRYFQQGFEMVKADLEDGKARPCMTTSLLEDVKDEDDQSEIERMIANVTAVAYGAGSDTTVSTLSSFVLAMVMFPEAQRKAQAELDRVVGQDRLPELEDRDSLPYVSALAKEVLRWRPPLPLGIPHKLTVDDEYEGYFIPAGTTIVGNSWAILHDPDRYPNPDAFRPERFLTADGSALDPDVPDPTESFGHGRRICPGRHFALDMSWLTTANVLAAFSIERPVDAKGNIVEPSGEYTSGIFSFPVPFEAEFKPRSAAMADLIHVSSLAD